MPYETNVHLNNIREIHISRTFILVTSWLITIVLIILIIIEPWGKKSSIGEGDVIPENYNNYIDPWGDQITKKIYQHL